MGEQRVSAAMQRRQTGVSELQLAEACGVDRRTSQEVRAEKGKCTQLTDAVETKGSGLN